MDKKKSEIIKEALVDYNEIVKTATTNAQEKLAKKFNNEFNSILNEELNKNNNNSTKESYKKIDENKESVSDKSKINEQSVMNEKKETKKVNESNEGLPFNKNLQTEEIDITELDLDSAGTAIEGSENGDEFMTIDEIEKEISDIENSSSEEIENSELENSGEEIESSEETMDSLDVNDDPEEINIDKLKEIRDNIDALISSMEGAENVENNENPEETNNDMTIDDINVDENNMSISDEDIDNVLNQEDDIEEAHSVTYPARRNVSGRNLPSNDYLSSMEKDQSAYIKESKQKIEKLMNENKTLTKKLNESLKYKKSATQLIEQYKDALNKYRSHLNEMSIFNTNLSHVNNILVNESLALTQEDKIKVINEFKKVNTISESKEKYKSLISEMKNNKKSTTENLLESKINNDVIQPSNKQILDEVVEKVSYVNNDIFNKMQKNIDYIEKRNKK